MRGNADPTFMERMNGIVLCLATACLYHALKAWSTGAFIQPPDFNMATAGGEFEIRRKRVLMIFVLIHLRMILPRPLNALFSIAHVELWQCNVKIFEKSVFNGRGQITQLLQTFTSAN